MVSPDAWQHAQWGMERPGGKEIQFALHANYGSNIEHYDEWHAYFRKSQPPTLIVWGKGDFVFTPAGAEAYRQDLKHVELHMLNAGHFALETNAAEIAGYIRGFKAARECGRVFFKVRPYRTASEPLQVARGAPRWNTLCNTYPV